MSNVDIFQQKRRDKKEKEREKESEKKPEDQWSCKRSPDTLAY